MKNTVKIILYSLGLVCLLATMTNMILWFRACARYEDFETIKQAYRSHFPVSLRGQYTLTFINCGMLAVSVAVFANSISAGFLKTLSLVLVIVSGFLLFWQIFSLM
ncbi:hypothetical protein FUA48_03740 [Flavobacterium alkalisoli]|uniref:Uncharacterized protein n=1 Tax=Flavobacterium alkalisoli TaxID=2602769 RepID=A0A5B9FNV1_9FLAO|nr:hypothetical protein [Flavobacterium alkalisoli]QEE48714.1 hypothetical protein FUA48_03740 [Flavobacterium alkalisoli]